MMTGTIKTLESDVQKAKDAFRFATDQLDASGYGPPSQDRDEDMRDARINFNQKRNALERAQAALARARA